MAYARAEDVADRWRPLSGDEFDRAETLADDASTLIDARFPGIGAQVASGAVDANVLRIVVAGMVKRAMITTGDDGITQESEAMGPFSRSRSFANPLGNVFLTAADVTLILGYQPSGQSVGFANDTTSCGDSYRIVYGW